MFRMRHNNRNNKEGATSSRLLFGLSGVALLVLAGLFWARSEVGVSVMGGPRRGEVEGAPQDALPALERAREAPAAESDSRGRGLGRAQATEGGSIRVVIEDETKGSPVFHLVLARIDDVLGEVHIEAQIEIEGGAPTRELHDVMEWSSEALSPGDWMVCVYQEAHRHSGYFTSLERYTETVTVEEGSVTEARFRFLRDPTPVGRIYGEVFTDEGDPPPALIGLWDETGRLVGGEVTRFFTKSNEFEMTKLPRGRYRVGALRVNAGVGWPAWGPVVATPQNTRVDVPVLGEVWRDGVELYPGGGSARFPGEVRVHPIVDGKLLFHVDAEEGPFLMPCPPLDEHEVRWLVLTEGHLPALLFEDDIEYFQERPRLRFDPTPGEGFALLVFEVTLDEVADVSELAIVTCGRGGLGGVQARAGGEVLGRSDRFGLIIGASPPEWREGAATHPEFDGPWLLPTKGVKRDIVGERRGGVRLYPLLRR